MSVYNSIWYQFASFAFVLAALFNDILLIRLSLVLGNLLLVINAAIGWPLWPDVTNVPNVSIDTLIWCAIALLFHTWATFVLLLDEKRMRKFTDENSESLYQFWKRRSGIGRRDFIPILEKGSWIRVPHKGTVLPCNNTFYLIVEGSVECEIEGWRRHDSIDEDLFQYKTEPFKAILNSGEVFDLSLCNVFNCPIGFFNSSFEATTTCDSVLLFSWNFDDLEYFASKAPPVVIQAWVNMISYAVADIAHRPWRSELERSHRFLKHSHFDIPKEGEVTEETRGAKCKSFFCWIINSCNPRIPRGLRHRAIPTLAMEAKESILTKRQKDYGSSSGDINSILEKA